MVKINDDRRYTQRDATDKEPETSPVTSVFDRGTSVNIRSCIRNDGRRSGSGDGSMSLRRRLGLSCSTGLLITVLLGGRELPAVALVWGLAVVYILLKHFCVGPGNGGRQLPLGDARSTRYLYRLVGQSEPSGRGGVGMAYRVHCGIWGGIKIKNGYEGCCRAMIMIGGLCIQVHGLVSRQKTSG